MRDSIQSIRDAGAELLVIDPHESWSGKYFLKDVGLTTGDVGYPLLLDPTHTVSALYGVAMQMRVHTELCNRPATIIVDRQGVIRYERRGKTFGDRPKVDEILAEVARLQP